MLPASSRLYAACALSTLAVFASFAETERGFQSVEESAEYERRGESGQRGASSGFSGAPLPRAVEDFLGATAVPPGLVGLVPCALVSVA